MALAEGLETENPNSDLALVATAYPSFSLLSGPSRPSLAIRLAKRDVGVIAVRPVATQQYRRVKMYSNGAFSASQVFSHRNFFSTVST